MGLDTHAIKHKNIEALQACDRVIRNVIQVGGICEIVEAICDHRKLAMDNLERRDLDFANAKWSVVKYGMRDQLWKAAAEVCRFEDILKDPAEVDPRDLVREDRHRAVAKIERPDIVQAE